MRGGIYLGCGCAIILLLDVFVLFVLELEYDFHVCLIFGVFR